MVAHAVGSSCYERAVDAAIMIIVAIEAQRQTDGVAVANQRHLGHPLKTVARHGRAVDILAVGGVGMARGVRERRGLAVGGGGNGHHACCGVYAVKAVGNGYATTLKGRL